MSFLSEFKKISDNVRGAFDLSSLQNPSNPTLALNLLTKNNEKTIKAALESCHDIVDEIIVVDTGSSDATKSILKSYPKVKLIEEAIFKGYSYHRNQAIKATKSDWILVFDSDEFLSTFLAKRIRQLIQSKVFSKYRMYSRWINKIYEDASATYVEPNKKFKGRYNARTRLFRNLDGIEFRGEIHESVFGLEKIRFQDLPYDYAVYHLDVAVNTIEQRLEKTLKRNNLKPGTAYPEEYLPELYFFKYNQVDEADLALLKYVNL
jgi:glycosyltransferase involved in cell wall biosynthesis